jgi:hypothetical protein
MISLDQFFVIQQASILEEHLAQGNFPDDGKTFPEVIARDAMGLKAGELTFDGFWRWNGKGLELTPKGKATDLVSRELLNRIRMARLEIESLRSGKTMHTVQEKHDEVLRLGIQIDNDLQVIRDLFPIKVNTFTAGHPIFVDLL